MTIIIINKDGYQDKDPAEHKSPGNTTFWHAGHAGISISGIFVKYPGAYLT